ARKSPPALDVAEANMHFDRKPFAETKVRTSCVNCRSMFQKSQRLESFAGSNPIGGNREPPNGGMMSLAGRWMRCVRFSTSTCRRKVDEKIVPRRLRIP